MDKEFFERVLYPCVRVRTAKAGGSGQVIHSSPENGTFVLTCHHVVEDSIELKDQWSPLLQRNIKKDILTPVTVEFFRYKYRDRAIGAEAVLATIVAYDREEDIALLHLEDPTPRQYVAKLFPCSGVDDETVDEVIDYGAAVVTVGAGMGEEPIMTRGNLCNFRRIIDNRVYWLSTAPSIFGNSGGATFLEETYEFVGMPARVAVKMGGFSADAITHMGYVVPVTRVVQFLKDNLMLFIIDDAFTYADCKKMIEERRKKAEIDMLLHSEK